MSGMKTKIATISAAVVAALGAGAVYSAAQEDSASTNGVASATTAIAVAAPEVSYGTFAAAEKSDVRPSERVQYLIGVINRGLDVDPYATRGVKTAAGKTAWIIPGKSDLCFGAPDDEGVGYACERGEKLTKDQLLNSASVQKDGSVTATYLVPDGVAALEVAGRRVEPTNNTVILNYQEGDKITRVDNDGTRTVVPGVER